VGEEGIAHAEVKGGRRMSARYLPDKGRMIKEGKVCRIDQHRTGKGDMEMANEEVSRKNVSSPKRQKKLRTGRGSPRNGQS
jgi:hypothetical protein